MNKSSFFAIVCGLIAVATQPAWAAKHYDTIIVGAGPTGLVAAIEAAKAGASVLVLEKRQVLEGDVPGEWASRHRVIGLQPRTFNHLKELGAHTPAGSVSSLEIRSSNGELVTPDLKGFQSVGLVKYAHVSVGRIEEALLEAARKLPIEFVFGAENTQFGDHTVTYEYAGQNQQAGFSVAALAIGSKTDAYESLFGKRIQNARVKPIPMISADFKVNETAGGFDMLKDRGPTGMIRAVALTANGYSSVSMLEPVDARKLTGAEFEAKADELLKESLKKLGLTGEIVSKPMRFDLGQDRLERVYNNGVFAIGDAARRTSPTTGLGVNLGIKDATAFAQMVKILKTEPAAKFELSLPWLQGIIEKNTQTSAEKSEVIQDVLQREAAKYLNDCETRLEKNAA